MLSETCQGSLNGVSEEPRKHILVPAHLILWVLWTPLIGTMVWNALPEIEENCVQGRVTGGPFKGPLRSSSLGRVSLNLEPIWLD